MFTIPNNFADLYRLPASILDHYRRWPVRILPARLADGASKVALYEYDNGTVVVESFNDAAVSVQVSVPSASTLCEICKPVRCCRNCRVPPAGLSFTAVPEPPASRFTIRKSAHSYAAFAPDATQH